MGRRLRLFCPTCPYVCPISSKIVKKESLVKREMEPIFSGDKATEFAPKNQATCPRCRHGETYFRQMQIRSQMTTFYTCCNVKSLLQHFAAVKLLSAAAVDVSNYHRQEKKSPQPAPAATPHLVAVSEGCCRPTLGC
ncbi:hypothetical protein J5N97_009717 [Dioscorea zingiberensis]|uniref:TFIIS-type domain-containing protein n=1 Tax=Dioscorea zingiberensis TaxID=325984 RepID=A0A9D5CZA0_9LILI|nr:hypothetical protein J5N97_009717 [Dioscorea zingiberensis]